MRIAVLRCQNLPKFVTWEIPNVDELFADDRLLIEEFARRGVEASSVVWRDPAIDWNQFDVALIRSTWDYVDAQEEFLATMARIEASSCRLFNPLEPVRWNTDKRYLLDLLSWEVPTVPTYGASRTAWGSWEEAVHHERWESAVLKPVIGTGGQAVRRAAVPDIARALAELSAEHPEREFLVQPFVESVLSEGEWSFIYVAGELTHVLQKKPAPDDYRAHRIYGGSTHAVEPSPQDVHQAHGILSRLPFDLLYARLDLVRFHGHLAVMELELIEPILYFNLAPQGIARLVDATLARP
jgi:glutathione synthase/RimK-type ligase-like ATP-grasp enzyme